MYEYADIYLESNGWYSVYIEGRYISDCETFWEAYTLASAYTTTIYEHLN